MAPTPKPEGTRVRRNLGQKQWRTLERGAVRPPPMPGASALPQRLRALARAYWKALWTEYGAMYTDADRYPLARLCKLHARSMVGRLSAQAEGELRQLETAFGGNPYGRQRLMIQVAECAAPADGGDEPPPSPIDIGAQRARRARLAAQR